MMVMHLDDCDFVVKKKATTTGMSSCAAWNVDHAFVDFQRI